MKTREIVKMTSELLNLQLPEESFEGDEPCQDVVKVLVNACNFVYEELYRDYATSLRKTVVVAYNGFIETSPFRMCKVISLVDGEGNDVHYRYGDGGIYVEQDGSYNLCYARIPDVLGWDDEVLMPSPRSTERMLVYGVAREYYSFIGDWASAQQWDARFKDALQASAVKNSSMQMPTRGWL